MRKEREKINGVFDEYKVERFKRLFLDSCIFKVEIDKSWSVDIF